MTVSQLTPMPPERVLVVGPAWVGDMVMAQSLFKILKQHKPELSIDVLAPAWSKPLLERMLEVNNAITLPLGHGQLGLKTRYRLGQQLRASRELRQRSAGSQQQQQDGRGNRQIAPAGAGHDGLQGAVSQPYREQPPAASGIARRSAPARPLALPSHSGRTRQIKQGYGGLRLAA